VCRRYAIPDYIKTHDDDTWLDFWGTTSLKRENYSAYN